MIQRYFPGEKSGVFIIILFHAVGAAGFFIPKWVPLFQLLVPFHLLLMLGVVLFFHQPKTKIFFTAMFLVMLAGWLVELTGVKTGAVFGRYFYGKTLGIKALDIPLMIGVNWFLLIYSVTAITQKFIPQKRLVQILAGAVLLVLMDVLIEPVAIRFDYWSWQSTVPPLQNYLGWFAVSFVLLWGYSFAGQRSNPVIGMALYLTQILFFTVLILGGKLW